jgi:D-xylose transport system substrate-binding protein
MQKAGIDPKSIPVTGQDAELAGVQRILAGTQFMSVYKPVKPMAELAAKWAISLANGQKITDTNTTEDNGKAKIPTVKIPVIALTADKVKKEIVDGGVYPVSQICTSAYKAACAKYGIK